jgi:hypothetical protein
MAIGIREGAFSTDAVIAVGREIEGSRMAGAERRPPGRLKNNYAQIIATA